MRSQVVAIRDTLGDKAESKPEPNNAAPFDVERATQAISQLKKLLEANDGNAAEVLPELQDAVAPVAGKEDLVALQEAMSDFDFEGALAKLGAIALVCTQIGK